MSPRPHRRPPQFDIAVANGQSLLDVDEEQLRQAVQTTLLLEKVPQASIELAVVDDPTIQNVNRQHLAHDYPTDVISFLYDCSAPPLSQAECRGEGRRIEGEVIVSAETAMRRAAEFGWHPGQELCLYVVHGVLHLCGYDDQSDEEAAIMRGREQAVLQKLGLTPHYE